MSILSQNIAVLDAYRKRRNERAIVRPCSSTASLHVSELWSSFILPSYFLCSGPAKAGQLQASLTVSHLPANYIIGDISATAISRQFKTGLRSWTNTTPHRPVTQKQLLRMHLIYVALACVCLLIAGREGVFAYLGPTCCMKTTYNRCKRRQISHSIHHFVLKYFCCPCAMLLCRTLAETWFYLPKH